MSDTGDARQILILLNEFFACTTLDDLAEFYNRAKKVKGFERAQARLEVLRLRDRCEQLGTDLIFSREQLKNLQEKYDYEHAHYKTLRNEKSELSFKVERLSGRLKWWKRRAKKFQSKLNDDLPENVTKITKAAK